MRYLPVKLKALVADIGMQQEIIPIFSALNSPDGRYQRKRLHCYIIYGIAKLDYD